MSTIVDPTRTASGLIEVVNVRHWRRGEYLYIGRPARGGYAGSPLANPVPLRKGAAEEEREACVAGYRAWILGRPELMAMLPDLRGRRLGCWCAPLPCHGGVLKELAEADGPSRPARPS